LHWRGFWEEYTGWNGIRITLFLWIFWQSQLHAVSLFPSELSNCDQTAHDGTVILTMDQPVAAVSGQSSGAYDQFSTILDQLASDRTVLLTLGAKTA
jgi:hypothetical protein